MPKCKSQVDRLIIKYEGRCYFCRKEISRSPERYPMRDWHFNSVKNKNRFSNLILSCRTCFNKRHPQAMIVKIDGAASVAKRMEHIGDAVALLAARILADERYGKDNRGYILFSNALVRNQNYATYPGIRHPDQFETILGQELQREGIEPALDLAKQMLKETKAYTECEQVCSTKISAG